MSYNCNGNYGGYGGSCYGGGYGGGYSGNNNKHDDHDGIRAILNEIGIGTRIRVHFDSTSHTGKFLGIQKGSVLIVDRNVPIFIPVKKVLAVDLVGFRC